MSESVPVLDVVVAAQEFEMPESLISFDVWGPA